MLLQAVVVAELLRPAPKPGVVAWADMQLHESLYIGAPCAALLLSNASRLPPWQRETARGEAVMEKALALFDNRILPFDYPALRAYGEIMREVRRMKFSIGRRDAMTAAIAKANGLWVACRNESPFLAAGLVVTNPWDF